MLAEATQTHLGFLQGLGYLGQAYLRATESHEALRIFSTYQARVPRSPWARVKRAEALARTGNLDMAINDTAAVLEEFPLSMMALTALASRQIDAKKLEAARQTLSRGLERYPDHPALLTRLSYVELDQFQETNGTYMIYDGDIFTDNFAVTAGFPFLIKVDATASWTPAHY